MRKSILADYLTAHRKKVGLSQRELADALGYTTPQFISNWERGVSFPPINKIKKTADLLKINPDDLYLVIKERAIKELSDEMDRRYKSSKK